MQETIRAGIIKYIGLLSRRRYFSLFTAVVATSAVVAYSYMAPIKYQASATVLFEKEKVTNPLEQGHRIPNPQDLERLTTIRQLILSRNRLLSVIKKLDLDLFVKTSFELEQLVENMRGAININTIGPNLYRISYEGNSPGVVKDVVNTICDLFIEENLGSTRSAARDAFNFIKTQLDSYKEKLEYSENALRLFKEENIGQLPGEENINFQNLQQYQNSLSEAESELKEARLQKTLLEEQLSGERPLVIAFSSRDSNSLEAQLAQLSSRLSLLLTNYTENYPEVISLKQQIKELKQKIAEGSKRKENDNENGPITESTTEALNPTYQQLKEDLAHINIKINLLQSRIEEYKEKIAFYGTKVESIPKQEQELARLTRDYNVNSEIYRTLLSKLEEARVSMALETQERSNYCQVVDAAQLPLVPSKPDRPKLILLGIACGLAAGFGIIYLFYYLDSSISGPDDAKNYFPYPVIGNIPIILCEEDIKRKRKGNLIFFSTVGVFTISILALFINEVINKYLLFK